METLQFFYYCLHSNIRNLFNTKSLEYVQAFVEYFHVA